MSDDKTSWEELCQKFISTCGPNFKVKSSYDNSTDKHIVRLYLRTGQGENKWSVWFSTSARQEEVAFKKFFKDVIVKHFSTEAFNRVGISFPNISTFQFSSEEELILKLEVM